MLRILTASLLLAAAGSAADRPRLLVPTDIGDDPDDQQSLIRLMVYANEFEIEGLIASAASTPGELKEAITRPDLIRQIVDAYGQVRPNLAKHAAHWPTADELRPQRSPEGWHRDLPARDGFDPRKTVSRWRPDFQRDFAQRISWCLPD